MREGILEQATDTIDRKGYLQRTMTHIYTYRYPGYVNSARNSFPSAGTEC